MNGSKQLTALSMSVTRFAPPPERVLRATGSSMSCKPDTGGDGVPGLLE